MSRLLLVKGYKTTDYVLPLKKGDRVRVVEKTSRGCLVKHGGTSGWYYGRLGEKGEET